MKPATFALLAVCLVVCVASVQVCNGESYPSGVGTVYYDSSSSKYSYVAGKMDATNGAAWGNFTDATLHASGFGEFSVKTNPKLEDSVQMHAAGYLEGALTGVRIHQHFDNMYNWTLNSFKNHSVSPAVINFLDEQDAWTRQNIASNKSALWQQMGLLYAQYDGLIAGYNTHAASGKAMTKTDFAIINGIGDLFDIVPAVDDTNQVQWDSLTPAQMEAKLALRGHCSGLIKLTGNYSDLFAGHSSWFTYASMLRIYKHYDFQVKTEDSMGKRMSFSSYPGLLSSLDDFYMMLHSNMVMVQTTNSVLNKELYKAVTPHSLLAWNRVRIANMMADSGQEWANVVMQYNSGTYNNQYMVVDYKLFQPYKAIPANTLWVVEQIPGLMMAADVTQQLERGYWPSYNVAYFPEIYNKSGYPQFIAKYQAYAPNAVAGLSYQLAPRAEIFRRDQGTVVDMASYKSIMRQNHYRTDPYSKGSPFGAICSRGDLAGYTGGCYDTKVTSATWIANQKADVINGPTTSGDILPPFSWTKQFDATAHVGQPETFDFAFETMSFADGSLPSAQ